jgi:hypothetical protein
MSICRGTQLEPRLLTSPGGSDAPPWPEPGARARSVTRPLASVTDARVFHFWTSEQPEAVRMTICR